MIRWYYIFVLLKDGIPYEVLSNMYDEEIFMMYNISVEVTKHTQDRLSAMMSN